MCRLRLHTASHIRDRLLSISKSTKKSIKKSCPILCHINQPNISAPSQGDFSKAPNKTQALHVIAAAALSLSKAVGAASQFISPAYSEKSFT